MERMYNSRFGKMFANKAMVERSKVLLDPLYKNASAALIVYAADK